MDGPVIPSRLTHVEPRSEGQASSNRLSNSSGISRAHWPSPRRRNRAPSAGRQSLPYVTSTQSHSVTLQRHPHAVERPVFQILLATPEVDPTAIAPHHGCVVVGINLKQQCPVGRSFLQLLPP